ncbi:alpha/beta fold hydrolase [Curtobacterium sp. RRHDQ10]|uniref:alpha/beta fold hydrolase n=1 Tax=Curtobacterium phyllosphaerae TaxID=3413379 RepID=UPI003BF002C0
MTRPLVRVVEVDGAVVRTRTLAPAGHVRAASGPTVVLVHGIGMSHRSFRRVHEVLSRSHRTITVDLPGHGGLPAPGRPMDIADLADVVVRALAAVGMDRAVLVGHSMGSQVVVEAALRHPTVVSGVVLVDPVVDDRRQTVRQQALGLFLDGFVEGVRMNAVVLTDYVRSRRQYPSALRAMIRYRLLDALPMVAVSVLVVRGTADPIARHGWVERVAAAGVDAHLVELRGPHQLPEHRPVALGARIAAFVADRARERAGR